MPGLCFRAAAIQAGFSFCCAEWKLTCVPSELEDKQWELVLSPGV